MEGTDADGTPAIRVPLSQVENVSPQRAARLMLERALQPFESLDDVFRRVDLAPDAWDGLARSGALSAFGSRREVLWHLGRLQKLAPKKRSEQLALDDLELPRDHVLLQVPSLEQSAAWDFATMNLSTGPASPRPQARAVGETGRGATAEVVRAPGGPNRSRNGRCHLTPASATPVPKAHASPRRTRPQGARVPKAHASPRRTRPQGGKS